MIKGSIQEEDITIVNICAPNIGAPQYIRQTQTQKEKLTVTQQQEILTLHSHQWTDHQNKINKETQVLNDTLDEIDLIDIFRTFHPNAEAYTFFSSAHRTFSRIDHILGHKSNFSKFKKIETIPSIFSDHNAVRLDINYKKKNSKKHKHMEINNQQISEKIKRKIKKSFKKK